MAEMSVAALLRGADGAAHSIAAQVIERSPSPLPSSFNGDPSLYLWNLFVMTATFFVGLMLVGRQGHRIWISRRWDHPLDPVSLYRTITLLAGIGLTLRCGAEAMHLWGYNPLDATTSARAIMAKRYIDPIAVGCGQLWMMIVVLAEPGIEHQLRKAPLPVDMWSRWPVLARALLVIALSFAAALVAVVFR